MQDNIEKCITIYEDNKIICVLIVNEIDLGYLDKKIITYISKNHIDVIINILDLFKNSQINIKELLEKLAVGFKTAIKSDVRLVVTAFELDSNNKNKTSRNKRMLKQENFKNYIKVVKHIGIKKSKYLRKR